LHFYICTFACIASVGDIFSSNTAFNKEELNAILKFGAEELFKETDEDDELQVNFFRLHGMHEMLTVLTDVRIYVVSCTGRGLS